MITDNFNKLNLNVVINNIQFTIKEINIDVERSFSSYNNNIFASPRRQNISMTAYTDEKNYMKLSDWFDNNLSYQKLYKYDFCKNGLNLYGVFPVEYEFTPGKIIVKFSVDHFEGDIDLFKLTRLRKEKLLKIAQLNDTNNNK